MNLSGSREYVERVARERLQNNITDRQVTIYGEEIETLGAAGELAARRFLKLPERLHINFDGGADIILNNITIDVKTTRLTPKIQNRFLQWPIWKPIKAKIILMAAVDLQTWDAEILGYAFAQEVENAPINHTRDYPCHEIPVSELHSAWNLHSVEVLRDRYVRYSQA